MHPMITQAFLIEKGYVAGEYRMPHDPVRSGLRRFPWLLKHYGERDLAQICPQCIRGEFIDFSPIDGETVRLIDEKGELVCFSLDSLFSLVGLKVSWLSSIRIDGEFEPREPLRSALGRSWLSRQKAKFMLSYSPRTQAAIIYYLPSPPPVDPATQKPIPESEWTIMRWFMERTKVTAEEYARWVFETAKHLFRSLAGSLLSKLGFRRKNGIAAPV